MSLIPPAPFPAAVSFALPSYSYPVNHAFITSFVPQVRRGDGGTSVVVQAPTGSGKTYIFELLYPNLKTQAVFAVPTRALVLDKHSNRYGSRHGCLYRKAVASVRDVVSIRNNESNWRPLSFGQMITPMGRF